MMNDELGHGQEKSGRLKGSIRWGLLVVGVPILILILSWLPWETLFDPLNRWVYAIDARYHHWLNQQAIASPWIVLPLALGGGLIASISPCVLGLLPINLSYIGTREIHSRFEAFLKAGLFVLGVVTAYSFLGLSSSFAGAVLVNYRGYIHLAVGTIVVLMGLTLLGILRFPLPQVHFSVPIAGSFGVGLTFALVSSPCSSPVMFSILAIAAEQGSPLYSTLTMVSYALGYTAVIFLASLFAGLVKQTRRLLNYSEAIIRISSVALIAIGGYYLVDGMGWLMAAIG